jgi:hypothetical protein
MQIQFVGCWNVSLVSAIRAGLEYGSTKRVVIAGAASGNGNYDGEVAGATIHVEGQGSNPWTLTVQNQDRLHGDVWVESPVQVTNINGGAGIQIAANDDCPPENRYDDLVLQCTECATRPALRNPDNAAWTWVSWGVKVDGGGLTGHGPVGPWDPFLRDFAAGLALADTARYVHQDLQAQVRALAAKQVQEAANAITQAMTKAKALK